MEAIRRKLESIGVVPSTQQKHELHLFWNGIITDLLGALPDRPSNINPAVQNINNWSQEHCEDLESLIDLRLEAIEV